MNQTNPTPAKNEKSLPQEGPIRLILNRLGITAMSLQHAEEVVKLGRREVVGRTAVPNLAGAFISSSVQAPQASESTPSDDVEAANLNTLRALAHGQAESSGITSKKLQNYEVSGSSHDLF